ncbi:hypothetical protein BJX68DRAFT_145994 [Aspergillus pseudodeflectus]|uniref:Zn(2)-C6 fungal-type domain-containing protein n=1 Tax=Aspergillus pseudodeflectus TaxID=176178 RepID=A0ABR4L3Y8_9EURO
MSSTGTRTRRRSRYGCRNCKIRKVKCDESKPQCKKCTSFGLSCTFMSAISDLQTTGQRLVVQRPVTNAVWISDASTTYHLNARCRDFITRYYQRSLVAPDDPNLAQVNRKLLDLAFTYPCLTHASLAVALTYDRHMSGSTDSRRTLEECHHWSQSTVLFNKWLRQPLEPQAKDAIWGTAAALVISSFSPDACTPEQAWPLRTSDCDLDWLRMVKGKMALWEIVDPMRPDSLFSGMAETYVDMQVPLPEVGIEGIPNGLVNLCGLDKWSTAADNPYFEAAHAVARILGMENSEIRTGHVLPFIYSIHGAFEGLLRDKDPVALILLYLWYRKAGQMWYIELRARVERPSICEYLRRYHEGNSAVQVFLSGGEIADISNIQVQQAHVDFPSI